MTGKLVGWMARRHRRAAGFVSAQACGTMPEARVLDGWLLVYQPVSAGFAPLRPDCAVAPLLNGGNYPGGRGARLVWARLRCPWVCRKGVARHGADLTGFVCLKTKML